MKYEINQNHHKRNFVLRLMKAEVTEIEQNQRITACFIVKFRSSFRFENGQNSLPPHEFRIRIRLTLKA